MDWDPYLYGFAEHAAKKSRDTTQVGAALVGPNREVRLTGFNGPPIGVKESDERRERPTKYLFASHAEQNVLAFAARAGIQTDGCTLYVTHHPCASCTRTIIQAGIKCVAVGNGVFGQGSDWGSDIRASFDMLEEAGVEVRALG